MERDLAAVISILIKKNFRTRKIYNISNDITYKKLVKVMQKSLNQNNYLYSINPIILRLFIIIFDKLLKIKIPVNNITLNSLITKTRFSSVKIKKEINFKKFTNINLKNIKELING